MAYENLFKTVSSIRDINDLKEFAICEETVKELNKKREEFVNKLLESNKTSKIENKPSIEHDNQYYENKWKEHVEKGFHACITCETCGDSYRSKCRCFKEIFIQNLKRAERVEWHEKNNGNVKPFSK